MGAVLLTGNHTAEFEPVSYQILNSRISAGGMKEGLTMPHIYKSTDPFGILAVRLVCLFVAWYIWGGKG